MFLWRNGLQAREIKAQLVRTNEYVKLIWQCVYCTYTHEISVWIRRTHIFYKQYTIIWRIFNGAFYLQRAQCMRNNFIHLQKIKKVDFDPMCVLAFVCSGFTCCRCVICILSCSNFFSDTYSKYTWWHIRQKNSVQRHALRSENIQELLLFECLQYT